MHKKVSYLIKQGLFYDTNPPLSPWQSILLKKGLSILYKPREIFWKKHLDSLNIKKGKNLLDLGCGQGVFLARLVREYGVKGTGVDISKKSIEFANKTYSNKSLKFINSDINKLPFRSSCFDYVVSFDVLEHIKDQEKAVNEMVRVLKKGGKILIYTLNRNYEFTLDSLWEKMGFDIFARAMHKKELLVNPDRLKESLVKLKIKVLYIDFFDAFFTLAVDELIMVSFVAFKIIGVIKYEKFGNIVLSIYSYMSDKIYTLLNFIDRFWYKQNRSGSFIVIGKKNN